MITQKILQRMLHGTLIDRARLGCLATVLGLAGLAPSARADVPAPGAPPAPPSSVPQLSQKFVIDDLNPEAHLPTVAEQNSNPMEFGYFLQDLVARAEAAKKRHDNSAVVRYDRAIAVAVPDQAKGWGQLCEAYQVVNDRERAIRACRYALERQGVELQDYVRFVGLIVSKPGELAPEERSEVQKVLDHLAADPALILTLSHLQCQFGAKTNDVALLETCTAVLGKMAPDDPKTVIFKWSLAVLKGQAAEAGRLIDRAKELGVIPDSIERMEKVTFSGSGGRRWPAWSVFAGALLLGTVAWLCWGLIRRRAFAR